MALAANHACIIIYIKLHACLLKYPHNIIAFILIMHAYIQVKLKTLIQDDKGHQHYLVEVIAIILKCFKDKFHKYLELAPFRKDERPLLCTDFEWLITVPAIWSAASKQMMKMAAQKVMHSIACNTHIYSLYKPACMVYKNLQFSMQSCPI